MVKGMVEASVKNIAKETELPIAKLTILMKRTIHSLINFHSERYQRRRSKFVIFIIGL